MGNLIGDYSDLIIDDEYWNEMAENIRARCEELGYIYEKYIGILANMKDNAITEGDTHEAIKAFKLIADGLNGEFELVGNHVDASIKNYLEKIDKADKYLY